jgi:Kef-type K+ transport system membrane component KefB
LFDNDGGLMENQWLQAALWIGLALVATLLSVRIAISIALLEIMVGVIGGNFLPLQRTEWVNFLAGFGSILLTFLAGAEVDPEVMKKKFRESMTIGAFSFLIPFLGVMAYAYYIAGWSLPEAQIAGISLSTTSVAVIYSVMIETGYNKTELGKIIIAATFITDLELFLLWVSYLQTMIGIWDCLFWLCPNTSFPSKIYPLVFQKGWKPHQ